MPEPIEFAARFIVALYAATRGRPGRFRRIADCAERAGIDVADIEAVIALAVKAGMIDRRVDEPEWVILTTEGLQSARLTNVRRPYADGKPE